MLAMVLFFVTLQYLLESVFKVDKKRILHLQIIYLIVLCPMTIFAALEVSGRNFSDYKDVIRLLLLVFAFAVTFVYIRVKGKSKK